VAKQNPVDLISQQNQPMLDQSAFTSEVRDTSTMDSGFKWSLTQPAVIHASGQMQENEWHGMEEES